MTQDKFRQRYEKARDLIIEKTKEQYPEVSSFLENKSYVAYFLYLSGAQGALESQGTKAERENVEKELEMLKITESNIEDVFQ